MAANCVGTYVGDADSAFVFGVNVRPPSRDVREATYCVGTIDCALAESAMRKSTARVFLIVSVLPVRLEVRRSSALAQRLPAHRPQQASAAHLPA
jgi:hypothetical protein